MIRSAALEDELGDVLEKALKIAGLSEDRLAGRTGIDVNRIKDALDYRYDLSCGEIAALASALGLNEAGLQALADNRYPEPEPPGLPICLHVLAMPYGVGVVNAFLVRLCASSEALLIDSGSCPVALTAAWPSAVTRLGGHFVTHWNPDHAGGCGEILERFNLPYCSGPGPQREGVRVLNDGDTIRAAGFVIEVLSTPGPASDHLCYLLKPADRRESRGVLFSGDLFFCGSIGGGFFDTAAVLHHARRLWRDLPADTVVAPGHGPLTTIGIEREFNPFAEQ